MEIPRKFSWEKTSDSDDDRCGGEQRRSGTQLTVHKCCTATSRTSRSGTHCDSGLQHISICSVKNVRLLLQGLRHTAVRSRDIDGGPKNNYFILFVPN